jgi:hypothetical protein
MRLLKGGVAAIVAAVVGGGPGVAVAHPDGDDSTIMTVFATGLTNPRG